VAKRTKFQQLAQTKSNKFKAVLIFEETVAMRTQDLELNLRNEKYINNRVFNVLHC
jgi:hypothetical protein